MYGQVSTGQEQEFDYGIKNNSTQTVTTPTYLGTVGADGTYGKILLADLQGKKAFLSTGLIKNGLISANGDPTKFNVTAGIGIISNFDDPENPISTIINFPAFTGITPTYLLTGTITYVAINNAAAIVMQATPFTPEQRRSLIVLGAVVHSNLTTINVINNISAPSNASTNQLHDFIEAVGALNLTGNKYTANGANLQLNKSAGLIFKLGSNFANDWKNPHELAQTAGTSLTFRYRTQNGTEGSDRINLDPALYDLNNVLTSVPNNKFTIQTVTMFQSGVTRIQYGQNYYDDLSSAKNAIFLRNFVLEPNSKENGIIRAYIIMRNTTTSLQTVADADILEAQKFGGVASGGVAITMANIISGLGYTPENVANKVTVLTNSNTDYPTSKAVLEALPTTYTKIVYVNDTTPTTATIFDLENPPLVNDNALKNDVNNLYIGTDASTWVYITSPAGYVTKTVTSETSNFNLLGTLIDSGNDKNSIISRNADIVLNGVRLGRGAGSIASNTALGTNALISNTTSPNNTAAGNGALRFNTGQSNTALGSLALNGNVGGSSNVGAGQGALQNNTSGGMNVVAGTLSGRFLNDLSTPATIVNNSTLIGYRTSVLGDNQTNQLVVGYDGRGLGSNTSVFGNSATVFGRWWGRLLVGGSVDNGVDTAQITGSILATSFKKLGGLSTEFLMADGSVSLGGGGSGDMVLATAQTVTGEKTFLDTKLSLRNVANTFSSYFTNTNTASRTYTLQNKTGTLAQTDDYGVVPLNEGGGIGYVINNRVAANYGAIGLASVDLSISTSASATKGATGQYAFTSGANTTASGQFSAVGGGADNTASGNLSSVIGGDNNQATATYSFVSGGSANLATGQTSSISGGENNRARSYGEWVGGVFGTDYTPLSTSTWQALDRQFNIGNGQGAGARSNALTLLKNGLATLPSVTNTLIAGETTGKAVITKEYLNRTYTVATLPTPASGVAYATVTDALAPTYMATIVGGGAVVTPVFYNGTNWVAH